MSNPINAHGSLLTLAAAAASANSPDQQNFLHRGVKVVVDVTVLGGTTPSITVTIKGRDPVSGKYFTILASAVITATGTTVLTVYPGATAAANLTANDNLPDTWRVEAVIAGTTPTVTATISALKLV